MEIPTADRENVMVNFLRNGAILGFALAAFEFAGSLKAGVLPETKLPYISVCCFCSSWPGQGSSATGNHHGGEAMMRLPKPRVPILSRARSMYQSVALVALWPLLAMAIAESPIIVLAVVVLSVALFPVWYYGRYCKQKPVD